MTITFESVVSVLTVVSSVSVKVLGEPHQIRENHRRRSTAGLSPVLYALSFSSYVLWTVHGLQIHDMTIVIAQSIGVVTSSVIIGQMIWMRRQAEGAAVVGDS